jgi:ATP-dependent DNA helicase RecG
MVSLSKTLCTHLRGVGEQLAEKLQKLDIHSVQDLLFHLPSRYEDRARITPLAALKPGDHVMIEGVVKEVEVRFHRRRSLLCYIEDDAGSSIVLRFFHFAKAQQDMLSKGNTRIRCFGEVRWGVQGYEMVHPEYREIKLNAPLPIDNHLTPIYPTTEGIQQSGFRRLTDQALALLTQSEGLEEYLPAHIRAAYSLTDVTQAVQYVHRPPLDAPRVQLEAGLHVYQQRLAFEELLAHQLSLRKLRTNLQQNLAATLPEPLSLIEQFLVTLPFSLTGAQQRVAKDVARDLSQGVPMLRLVQGDVGSGKTVVAALASLQAIGNGYQAALMAPTELLSEQHFQNFKRWMEPLNIKVVLLSGNLKAAARREALAAIQNGEAKMVIGTHALFQKAVNFHRLALVIIDEQHRFGVHQRLSLRQKGKEESLHSDETPHFIGSQVRMASESENTSKTAVPPPAVFLRDKAESSQIKAMEIYPHQLIMTATPIPRTLAMTAYADLDCSIIDELPPGRKPVTTILVSNARRDEVVERIAHACQSGQQAYWVCTLIEESETLQREAAEVTAERLSEQLPHLNIGLVHGRLKAVEKENVMQQFRAGEINLLVATTVIEVGVDVPNASLMVIENPERLGLAQLHQLRGRIGRGMAVSHCVLMYQNPLSHLAKRRLHVMKSTQDGFVIAQEDLVLRGPGEVLGTRQTGLMQMRIADLSRDSMLLPKVQQVSETLMEAHPECVDALIHRWIGQAQRYGEA